MMIGTVLLVVAMVMFLLGAISPVVTNPPAVYSRVNFISLGLFFWVLAELIGHSGLH
jgi:hypothetical protein